MNNPGGDGGNYRNSNMKKSTSPKKTKKTLKIMKNFGWERSSARSCVPGLAYEVRSRITRLTSTAFHHVPRSMSIGSTDALAIAYLFSWSWCRPICTREGRVKACQLLMNWVSTYFSWKLSFIYGCFNSLWWRPINFKIIVPIFHFTASSVTGFS